MSHTSWSPVLFPRDQIRLNMVTKIEEIGATVVEKKMIYTVQYQENMVAVENDGDEPSVLIRKCGCDLKGEERRRR